LPCTHDHDPSSKEFLSKRKRKEKTRKNKGDRKGKKRVKQDFHRLLEKKHQGGIHKDMQMMSLYQSDVAL
jgi:hypothetical protein